MSMKNEETWRFAHEHCGRVWLRVGLMGSLVCLAQLVPLIGAIFPTERALRREFDENGNRRETRE